jgi:hypothetical protein
MMLVRFLSALTVASADSEGLHLLQTSAHQVPSSSGCPAAKAALKTARQSAKAECADEEVDYVEQPESSNDKYKIFPPPEATDEPSSFKSCKQGWMAHVSQQRHTGNQCWDAAFGGHEFESVTGPLVRDWKVFKGESNYVTPDECVILVNKIVRITGICNPNATTPNGQWPAAYRFTGCAAEFVDGSHSDVMETPDHLLTDRMMKNSKGHPKFGRCMLCGKGNLGPYNIHDPSHAVTAGYAGLTRRDFDLDTRHMTCILNPEEKDQFELHVLK